MRCIGLVGGLGIGAACHSYQVLGQSYPSECGPLELCLVHAHMSTVFDCVSRNQPDRLANYLLGLIERLHGAGATIIAIPAVTPHFCIAQLIERSPLPIVNLLEVIIAELQKRQLKRVAVFGTRYVMESNLFGSLDQIAEVVPLRLAEIEQVHELYLRFAQRGVAEPEDIFRLNTLAQELYGRDHIDAILLAGTDFSVVPTHEIHFAHVDCTAAHLAAITRQLCRIDTSIQGK